MPGKKFCINPCWLRACMPLLFTQYETTSLVRKRLCRLVEYVLIIEAYFSLASTECNATFPVATFHSSLLNFFKASVVF